MDLHGENSVDAFHRLIEQECVDVFKSVLKTDPSLMNARNDKGEIALHKACTATNVNALTQYILENGSDVNAQNYWGQTPLHYAAEYTSTETIKLLLRTPGIQVNCKDVNGYTVLHTFVSSSQTFDDNWIEGIKLLVDANIDINAQTNYGQTVLHLVSTQDDNTEFLKHLLARYQNFELNLRNTSGENFLHVYCMNEIGEICMTLFESIQTIKKPVLQKLFSQKDINGSTPWCLMLENGELNSEHVRMLKEDIGVSLDATDNLGNTALMRCVGKSGSSADYILEIYKFMLENDIDLNCQNVFGHSVASLLYSREVFTVFSDSGLNWTTRDRWGRLPVADIMLQKINPNFLETLLNAELFMVNSKDTSESTLLHFAAYLGEEKYTEIILKHGADLGVRDVLGDTPIDTARRHGNAKTRETLAKAMHFTCAEDDIFLYKAPSLPLNVSSLLETPIKELLRGFPKHIETFAERALDTKYIMNMEISDITVAVNKHVRLLCEIVRSYDRRFSMFVFNTGSTAEGTKVGTPDEFDFALCLESLNDVCDIEVSTDSRSFGYAKLKYRENPVSDEFISFSDTKRYFLSLPYLHILFRYIRRALNERKLWENGNLFKRSENKLHVIDEKPVFNYRIYWNGTIYKQLVLSIDLVPAVYRRGWWPSYASFENKTLMNDEVKAAGCLILMQTEENNFNNDWYKMNDSVTFTCKSSSGDNERQLLISIAPAEIALMKSLPEVYRRGYALAKIVKSSDICPGVKIDIKPPLISRSLHQAFEPFPGNWKSTAFVNPSNDIKSYWLKNCLYYIADEMGTFMSQENNPLQITTAIYQKLQEYAVSWNFTPYILEKSDLFEYSKEKNRFDVFFIRRKIAIDTVLAILGQPFPQDLNNWMCACYANHSNQYSQRV